MKNGIASLSPENLLSDPQPPSLSARETITTFTATLVPFETSLEGFRYWAGRVKLHTRATLASMAMAGLHLRALRVFYFGERNPKGGRPKKTPHVAEFPDWPSMLADVAGISDQTARRWMQIADVVEAMAEKEGSDVISICGKLPWEWTPEESERLGETVQRITQDKTQRELLQSDFLSSLGYVEPERINSSNNPLGKNGGKKKPAVSSQEAARERQEAARLILFGTEKPGFAKPGSVAFFINHAVNSKGAEIQDLPRKELEVFYELELKPFTDLVRDMIKQSGR